MSLVECVPNFSEGRDSARVAAIADAARDHGRARVLHVDPERDTNRFVLTLMGPGEEVAEAAFHAVQAAVSNLDMRQHQGSHPRMGAADVCPFIPWNGVNMETCVDLAEGLAQRCAEELDLPVWLYGAAARQPWNRYLADIRRGQFEGLAGMLQRNPPDFGPATPHPTAGALAVGAREVLIAWNVTLDTDDVALARSIASGVREFQHVDRDAAGRAVCRETGGLPGVRALGWMSQRDGAAQVTMNLTRWREAPPHVVYEALAQLARDAGISIRGSELVGMVPLEALRQAGQHFGEEGLDDTELVARAVSALGLGEIVEFNPHERILEWVLEDRS